MKETHKIKLALVGLMSIIFPTLNYAQTIQQGVIKEYKETAQKTPLAGVELSVRSAGSTFSDNRGEFSLSFLTLKKGEHIDVRRIQKAGYEIFNKDAVEQWNLNPNEPFVIVMCRSDKFKQLCDIYYSKASENYKKQYDKGIATYKKLLASGQIAEKEYLMRIAEIQESYDRQLDNLDSYIDRFARIDLSEINEEEQEIIQLMQQGFFEEAVAKYESLNLTEKFINICLQDNQVNSALEYLTANYEPEKILESINRQIETLALSGTKEGRYRIAEIMKTVADTDELNLDWQMKTAQYLADEMHDYVSTLHYYTNSLNVSIKINGEQCEATSKIYKKIAETYGFLKDNENSLKFIEKALQVSADLFGDNSIESCPIYNSLAISYFNQGDYDSSRMWLEKAIVILTSNDLDIRACICLKNIAMIYANLGLMNEAISSIERAISICEKFKDDEVYTLEKAKIYNNYASICAMMNDYENAMGYYQSSLNIFEKYKDADHPDVAFELLNIAYLYAKMNNYPECVKYCLESIGRYKSRFGESYSGVIDTYRYLVQQAIDAGAFDDAIEFTTKELRIQEANNFDNSVLAETYGEYIMAYLGKGDYDTALEYATKALNLLGINPQYEDHRSAFHFFIGSILHEIKNYELAFDNFAKIKRLKDDEEGYSQMLQGIYMSYLSTIAEEGADNYGFDKFRQDKIIMIKTPDSEENIPYALLEFNDWEIDSLDDIFIADYKTKDLDKDIVIKRGNDIVRKKLTAGIPYSVKIEEIDPVKKEEILTEYSCWKSNNK